jgi:hypothetical protein
MAEKFVLQRFRGNFVGNSFPEEQKKSTKYDMKTLNAGRKQNLNRILIINLLLLATKCDTTTDGIAEHIFVHVIQGKSLRFQLLVVT